MAKVADKSAYRCPDCGKVFVHACRLRRHMKSHKTKKALLRKARQIKTEVPAHTLYEFDLNVWSFSLLFFY